MEATIAEKLWYEINRNRELLETCKYIPNNFAWNCFTKDMIDKAETAIVEQNILAEFKCYQKLERNW